MYIYIYLKITEQDKMCSYDVLVTKNVQDTIGARFIVASFTYLISSFYSNKFLVFLSLNKISKYYTVGKTLWMFVCECVCM